MGNCVTLASISPAANCLDIDNRAGVVNRILLAYAEDVAVYPQLPSASAEAEMTLEEAGKWKGEIAMKEGKSMVELHFTDQTGTIAITDQGEVGGESFLYELTLVRAKINAQMAGFENAVKGRGLVIIAEDRNGIKYLMGDSLCPAYKVAGDGSTTGATTTDRNQTTLKFSYACPRKLVYDGDLESLVEPAGE